MVDMKNEPVIIRKGPISEKIILKELKELKNKKWEKRN